jgi:1-aminocyclopropane-1-carboxylate deaminase/D-cysteine desulfhydrase-like pyridoxal-dependent ACC family enzyme
VARTEGILLDPVYTGKAMAGLIGLIREGQLTRDQIVVFVHTGGAVGLFADSQAGTFQD